MSDRVTQVSWEYGEPAFGEGPGHELWVRVLSTHPHRQIEGVPDEILGAIPADVLSTYNPQAATRYGDLRQDDDETVIEWPYEQWWALTKAS